jgi:UDP-N-acetylmuramoylalanine--D-glutamate ligase
LINLPTLTGETAVFGLGRSGMAAVQALLAAGNRVVAWDDNEAPRLAAQKAGAEIRNLVDAFALNDEAPARLIVSPGVPLTHPAPHPVVAAAHAAGCAVLGDLDLFAMALEAAGVRDKALIIGITGTNGKSTTTALLSHMLATCGMRVESGGNIGVPVLHLPTPEADAQTVYVLELSSYQLDLNRQLACDIGVVLNITPDHLDRHGDMTGYIAAKEAMFANGKCAQLKVIGADDAACRDIATRHATGAPTLRIAATHTDADIFYADGCLWEGTTKLLDMTACPALPGAHNGQNAAAAFAIGRKLGLDVHAMTASFARFGGMAHRLQSVRRHGGLNFVNDSKATNGEATRHALAAFDNIYWIAGGVAKAGGLNGLAPLYGHVRAAFLIGEAADSFQEELAPLMPTHMAGTMANAVALAADHASAAAQEAVILLSPACASFDQFSDFEARGEAFCTAVAAWCDTHKAEGVA